MKRSSDTGERNRIATDLSIGHIGLLAVVATVLSVALAAGAGTAAAQDTPELQVDDAEVDVGNQTSVDVTLSEVPDGLTGFRFNVTVDDTSVATIQGASYNEQFRLQQDPVVKSDGSDVGVDGIDLDDNITAGDGPVHLVTVDLQGEDHGAVTVDIDVEAVDDENGNLVNPSVNAGTLTVGDGPQDTPTDAEDSDTDTPTDEQTPDGETEMVGPTVLVTLLSLMAMAGVGLRAVR